MMVCASWCLLIPRTLKHLQLELRCEMVLLQSYKPLLVHSPRAFEKSDKTKKKPDSRNLN